MESITEKTKKTTLKEPHVRVHRFVQKFIVKNFYPPTREQIAGGTKISYRHIHRLVDELVSMGYFEKDKTLAIIVIKDL